MIKTYMVICMTDIERDELMVLQNHITGLGIVWNEEERDEDDEPFYLPNIANVTSKDEATQLAVDYQNWASEQSLSYADLAEYSGYFADLATKFNLTEEFRENGII